MLKEYTFKNCDGKLSLLELLQKAGACVSPDCGGQGVCGKCTVYVNEEQIKTCSFFPLGDVTACVPEKDEEDIFGEGLSEAEYIRISGRTKAEDLALCVDLGTTTVAAALVDVRNKYVLARETRANSQRKYGADTISRLSACADGKGEELRALAGEDVRKLKEALLTKGKKGGIEIETDSDIPVYIAGNTVMSHIFAGVPVAGLGSAPYEPFTTDFIVSDGYTILPCVSAFIGGDVLIGIIASGAFQSDRLRGFIDMGTNGEMAVGNRDRILSAGTAAGPALEGGNISCGSPARKGAVSSVRIIGRLTDVSVAGGGEGLSICGTGIVEAVSEFLKNGIMDENGNMDEEYDGSYSLCPKVTVTQEDIRQVQLAKGAIRAGMETLLDMGGIHPDDLDSLWIAGGFGKKLNAEKCCHIGLINPLLRDRCVPVGNTSLLGTVKYAFGEITDRDIEMMKERIEPVNLADSEEFKKSFITYMNFK